MKPSWTLGSMVLTCILLSIGYVMSSEQEVNIQGGSWASNHEFPFMVSLRKSNSMSHFCGGTLISKRHILSAGHCAFGTTAESVSATFGFNKLSDCVANGFMTDNKTISVGSTCIKAKIKKITIHPQYDDITVANDIAIFELYDDIPFGSTIKPLCVNKVTPSIGSTHLIAGWGVTSSSNTASNQLVKAYVPLVDIKYCNDLGLGLPPKDLCAGAGKGVDACAGDSGGPLAIFLNQTWFQSGVTSYGPTGCGVSSSYTNRGVYTEVAEFYSWVASNANLTDTIDMCSFKPYVPPAAKSQLVAGSSPTPNIKTNDSVSTKVTVLCLVIVTLFFTVLH